jgi:hypothetical protein
MCRGLAGGGCGARPDAGHIALCAVAASSPAPVLPSAPATGAGRRERPRRLHLTSSLSRSGSGRTHCRPPFPAASTSSSKQRHLLLPQGLAPPPRAVPPEAIVNASPSILHWKRIRKGEELLQGP